MRKICMQEPSLGVQAQHKITQGTKVPTLSLGYQPCFPISSEDLNAPVPCRNGRPSWFFLGSAQLPSSLLDLELDHYNLSHKAFKSDIQHVLQEVMYSRQEKWGFYAEIKARHRNIQGDTQNNGRRKIMLNELHLLTLRRQRFYVSVVTKVSKTLSFNRLAERGRKGGSFILNELEMPGMPQLSVQEWTKGRIRPKIHVGYYNPLDSRVTRASH